MRRLRSILFWSLLLGGCSASPDPRTPLLPEEAPPDLGPAPPAIGGLPGSDVSVQGTVSVDAELPPMRRRPPWPYSDPPLKHIPPSEGCIVDSQLRLRWAIVYVKAGLEGQSFGVPKEQVQIQLARHRFWPHVAAVRAGQEFRIANADTDFHTVHNLSFINKEFTVGLPQNTDTLRRFTVPELPLMIKDDIHPWERIWMGVFEHPFFAVTGPDGRYELRGLPPGKYTLTLWQETFQGIDREIEIQPGVPLVADFALRDLKT